MSLQEDLIYPTSSIIGRTGRAGNTGLATAFVNEGDKNILQDLWELLKEANQKIPQWFDNLIDKVSNRRRTPNKKSFQGKFGGKDIRKGQNNYGKPKYGYDREKKEDKDDKGNERSNKSNYERKHDDNNRTRSNFYYGHHSSNKFGGGSYY